MQALLKETEKLLDTWKHPDPYIHPTAPGGSLDLAHGDVTKAPGHELTKCAEQAPNTREIYPHRLQHANVSTSYPTLAGVLVD